jgi:hypothetical protein
MKFNAAQKKAIIKFDDPEFIKNIKEEDPTMVKHLDILKEINKYGYLTKNSQAGRKSNEYERAYIQGFMMKKNAIEFLKRMNINTDKNAIYVSVSNNNIESSFDIPLTIEKNNKWEVVTHMSTTVPLRIWDQERKYLNLDKDVVYIFCWDPKWNRNASTKTGLFTDVLKILKTI